MVVRPSPMVREVLPGATVYSLSMTRTNPINGRFRRSLNGREGWNFRFLHRSVQLRGRPLSDGPRYALSALVK